MIEGLEAEGLLAMIEGLAIGEGTHASRPPAPHGQCGRNGPSARSVVRFN
jgi:hypothetical protein